MSKIKIIHLTPVHPRYDTRIYVEEYIFLAKRDDYDISIIVMEGIDV